MLKILFSLFSQPPGYNQGNTLVIVILLSDCLQYSNSAINPVLYAFLSDNFKKSFRKACHCDKRDVTGGLGHNQDCSATTRSVVTMTHHDIMMMVRMCCVAGGAGGDHGSLRCQLVRRVMMRTRRAET